MNRDDFIIKQLNKFGCFNDNNMAIWKADYEKVLQEPNINYEKLDDKIVFTWDNTFEAPSTPWIMGAKQDCIPKEERCEALINIEQMRENTSPPTADVRARVEAIRKKLRAV